MSGEQELEGVDAIEQSFLDFLKSYGFSNENRHSLIDECEGYLLLSKTEIVKLSSIECGEIAIRLSQYNIFLQQQSNILSAKMKWAEANTNKSIANEVRNYDKFAPYVERRIAAIKNNGYAEKMDEIKTRCELRLQLLDYLTMNVKNLADFISEYGKGKRYE